MRPSSIASALLLGLLLGNAAGQDSAPARSAPIHIVWEGSLESAMARAQRLHRPILVAVLRPGDRGSRRLLDEVYIEPEVRRLLRELVCLVACSDPTPPIESGPRQGMSTVFQTVTPAEHQAVEAAVRARYLGDEASAPQHLLLDPQGHLIQRKQGFVGHVELTALLRQVLDGVDAGWRGGEPATARESAGPAADTGVQWAGIFDPDERKRAATVDKLFKEADRATALSLYRQVVDAPTKGLFLAAARHVDPGEWTLTLVREALGDKEPMVRAQAAVTAERAAKSELVEDLTARLKKEKDEYAACEMLRALAACAGKDEKALAPVLAVTKGREAMPRAWAYVALAMIPGPEQGEHPHAELLLKRGLKDDDELARYAAVWGLGQVRDKRALKEIESLVKRVRGPRREMFQDAVERIQGADPQRWRGHRRFLLGEKIER